MYASLGEVTYWATFGLAIPTAGFLMRTFIVFHDCTHGSFLPSRRANLWVGRLSGLLVFQPFANWRHTHAVHHGTAGDLGRRGTGDISTLTFDEYVASPWRKRLGYRLFRNPLVMFGIGPLWSLMFGPRLWSRSMRPRQRRSVVITNLFLAVLLGAICWLVGWQEWLLVQMPSAILAGTAGVWLFYVQHQFEDVYWDSGESWGYADAALRGSSYLKLPQPFQFFTGNIGLHHVHHLSAKVPNYNLQRAHNENPIFRDVPVLTATGRRRRDPAQGDRPGGRSPAYLVRGPRAPRRGSRRNAGGPLARATSVRREFRAGESGRSGMGGAGFEQIAPGAPGKVAWFNTVRLPRLSRQALGVRFPPTPSVLWWLARAVPLAA
jgi:acyl-lipid omega-6 desaturase (Delta-12 desaturase)